MILDLEYYEKEYNLNREETISLYFSNPDFFIGKDLAIQVLGFAILYQCIDSLLRDK